MSSVTSALVLDRQLDTRLDTLRERHITLHRNLSHLPFDEILQTDLQLAEYIPLAGLMFRELPHVIAEKHAIIIVQNVETRCFRYAVLSARHPRTKHPQRPFCY